jgi:hypothetical protein
MDDLTYSALDNLERELDAEPRPKSAFCADALADLRFHLHVHAKAMISEIRRHRVAQRARTEQLCEVVEQAVLSHPDIGPYWRVSTARDIGARVAEKLAESEPMPREADHGSPSASAKVASALSADDARELAERRALDTIRKAEIEELVARRNADLDSEDRVALHWARRFVNDNTEPYDSEAGSAMSLFDRLLVSAPPSPSSTSNPNCSILDPAQEP